MNESRACRNGGQNGPRPSTPGRRNNRNGQQKLPTRGWKKPNPRKLQSRSLIPFSELGEMPLEGQRRAAGEHLQD